MWEGVLIMEREIKFRAMSLSNVHWNPKWVYGYLFKTPLTAENFEADSFQSGKNRWCISTDEGVVYEIDIKSLSQFTGLKDKKGKEIYAASDIFKFTYLEELDKKIELIGIFTFSEEDLRYEIDVYGNIRYLCLSYIGNGVFSDFEIIGTKQENPELLDLRCQWARKYCL